MTWFTFARGGDVSLLVKLTENIYTIRNRFSFITQDNILQVSLSTFYCALIIVTYEIIPNLC